MAKRPLKLRVEDALRDMNLDRNDIAKLNDSQTVAMPVGSLRRNAELLKEMWALFEGFDYYYSGDDDYYDKNQIQKEALV